jgi:hypothetical protein
VLREKVGLSRPGDGEDNQVTLERGGRQWGRLEREDLMERIPCAVLETAGCKVLKIRFLLLLY